MAPATAEAAPAKSAPKAPPPDALAYSLGVRDGVAQTLAANAAEAAKAEADLAAKAAEAAKAEADAKAKAVPLITAKQMPRPRPPPTPGPKPTLKALPTHYRDGTPVVHPGQPGQVPPDIICQDE